MKQVFQLPEYRMAAFEDVVARANRKAAKLGVEPFTVAQVGVEAGLVVSHNEGDLITHAIFNAEDILLAGVLDREPVEGETRRPVNLVTVEVTGQGPVVEGWRFAATLDHDAAGNVVNQLPEDDVVRVSDWVKAAPACEHCGLDRQRNKTYLLVEVATGALKQVGSTCIRDFFGGVAGEQMAKLAETWTVIALAAEQEDGGGWSVGGEAGWMRAEVMIQAVACVRQEGWVSKGVERDTGRTSTASMVLHALTWRPSRHEPERPNVPNGEDVEIAEAVLDWVDGLEPDPSEDYLWNLTTAVGRPVTTWKLMGLVVSAVSAWEREVGAWERASVEEATTWVRVPWSGERVEVEGTVLSMKEVGTDFGMTWKMLLQVEVEGGACKLWGTIPKGLGAIEVGARVRFTARVNRSDRDEAFGFWSRPTKAEVLEEVAS